MGPMVLLHRHARPPNSRYSMPRMHSNFVAACLFDLILVRHLVDKDRTSPSKVPNSAAYKVVRQSNEEYDCFV